MSKRKGNTEATITKLVEILKDIPQEKVEKVVSLALTRLRNIETSTAEILPPSTRKLAAAIAKSPKRSRAFLVEAGISTKSGKLTARYR